MRTSKSPRFRALSAAKICSMGKTPLGKAGAADRSELPPAKRGTSTASTEDRVGGGGVSGGLERLLKPIFVRDLALVFMIGLLMPDASWIGATTTMPRTRTERAIR